MQKIKEPIGVGCREAAPPHDTSSLDNGECKVLAKAVASKVEAERREYNPREPQLALPSPRCNYLSPSPLAESKNGRLSTQEILEAADKNEMGAGQLLVKLFINKYVFDHATGEWNIWKGNYWETDCVDDHFADVAGLREAFEKELVSQYSILSFLITAGDSKGEDKARKAISNIKNQINKLQTVAYTNNVLTFASRGTKSLAIEGTEWDSQSHLLGCRNGVIDLKTGQFRPDRPEDMIKTVVPTKWEGLDTPAPRFIQFLHEIFDGDKELPMFIIRLFGYALTGECTEQIFPIFYGSGKNGKTTLFEVIREVLGPVCGPVQSGIFLRQSRDTSPDSPSPSIIALRGKRIVWGSETDTNQYLNVAKIKNLSGGDTLSGRPPHGKRMVEFRASHTLFLLTNHKPRVPADDYALWQRLLLVPFSLSFVDNPAKHHERKRDSQLRERLLVESPGILATIIRGCLMYREIGLDPPRIVKEATAEYRRDEDLLSLFLEEKCVLQAEFSVRAGEFYKAYRQWVEVGGFRKINEKEFGLYMTGRFKKETDSRGRYYKGVGLVKQDDQFTNFDNAG